MKIIKKRSYLPIEEDSMSITVTDFTADTAKEFMERMFVLESDPHLTDIVVYVTSYGGELLGLLSMIETIKTCKKNVHVVAMGEADSCGAFIVATGPEGNRWMSPNGYMLIHEIRSGMYGPAAQLQKISEHTQVMQNELFRMVVKNSLLTIEGLRRRIKEHDGEWLIQPEEALNLKLVDKIGVPKIKTSTIWELEE